MVKASVISLTACQDNQRAFVEREGENGLFTKHLLEIWDDGKFSGNYLQFHEAVWSRIKYAQSPNYYLIGFPNSKFEMQKPFET